MNEELLKHAKNGDKKSFTTAYQAINKNATQDAIDIAYNAAKAEVSSSSSKINYGDTGGGALRSGITGLAQLGTPTNSSFQGKEYIGLESYSKGVNGIINSFKTGGGISALWKGVINVQEQGLEVLRQETVLRNDINSKMGVTGKYGDAIRDAIMTSASYGQKLGFSIKDASDAFISLNQETGRFAVFSDTILQQGFKTAGAFLPTLGDLGKTFAEFEKIGAGFTDTLTDLNDIGKMSMEIGLNGKQTIADVRANIEQINKYGFKDGTKGLAEMSRMAKMFRMDMQGAFTIADKVMNPEGAVELSAKLQVLGGAIGAFNDPFKLMYDATNNVEGLQKALVGAAAGLATYNEEQGRFEVTGANLRMANEMASITGVKMEELTKGAIAAQEKIRGLQQLATTNLQVDPKEKDFLLNLAHMEHGEMKITIPQSLRETFKGISDINKDGMISLNKLNDETFGKLMEYQKEFEQMNPEDIARGQFTLMQQISNDVSAISSYFRGRLVQGASGVLGGLGMGAGVQYAAKALNLGTRNLTEYAESNGKFEGTVKDAVQKGLNFLSMGMAAKAKEWFNKADVDLSKQLRDKVKADNLQKGTTGQIQTKSIVEETLGSNGENTTNETNTKMNVYHHVTVSPGATVENIVASALIKKPDFGRNFGASKNKYSYDNDAAMHGV
jgi:hypothetical protein